MIKVDNDKNQNPTSVMRTFSKRVTSSGVLRNARAIRYHTRTQSELSKKKSALKRIEKRVFIAGLIKMGKPLPEKKGRRR